MTKGRDYFARTRQEEFLARGVWRAPRKVLAIQASHRGSRGFTDRICQAVVQGMIEAGAQVEAVALADLTFSACAGCFRCWGPDWGRCPLDDDLTTLIGSIPSFDLMFWAMPLYVDGMPGLLKNLVDRMMVLNHPAILDQGGRCIHPCRHADMPYLAVAAVCGFWGPENFAPLVAHLGALALDQHTPLLAFLERPESLSLMHLQGRETMAAVEEALAAAGRQLIENGNVEAGLARDIARPLLARSRYMELAENWWKGRK